MVTKRNKLTKQNDALILLLQEEKYLLNKANELTSANINQNGMIISMLKNIEMVLRTKRCYVCPFKKHS